MKIIKRDGTHQHFDISKIKNALIHAFTKTGENYKEKLLTDIYNDLMQHIDDIDIEYIQDIVEKHLILHQFPKTAKHYILYRFNKGVHRTSNNIVKKIADNIGDIEIPWGPIGYITYKRTYSRNIDDETTEEFKDTAIRVLTACQNQLGVGFTNEELREAYIYMMNLKFSVAGRFLWQLGTTTVNRLGLTSLQNCAFIKIDEPVYPFIWTFDCLMLGCGVGFNIQKENVNKIPPVLNENVFITRKDTPDADYIIPDSREGWCHLMEKVLEAFFIKGKSFTYSTILIRPKGAPIKGFGGISSGPEELCKGVHDIQMILRKRCGQKLRPIDALDMINIIATVVVSGNVRRSALIAIGDHDDLDYLMAKNWASGNIPNWRAMSNNSVVCDDTSKLPEEFWKGYDGSGECYGLINIDLARKIGRIVDGNKYPDPEVAGFNPCITGDSKILTSEGEIEVKDLVGKQFTAILYGNSYLSTEEGFWSNGEKEVYKITLENGMSIKATEDHRFMRKIKADSEPLYDNEEDGYNWKTSSPHTEGRKPHKKEPNKWIRVNQMKEGYTELVLNEPHMFSQRKFIVTSIVKEITKMLDKQEVYDCTIPGINCFSANGIITHNCAEQSLANAETCCLSELYLPNLNSYEEAKKVATVAYRICKHSLALPCHLQKTFDIVSKNMRMGIGVTGYLQATKEQKSWLPNLYEYLRIYDETYSTQHQFNTSIKLTTVKPSGTLSLLAGVVPGAHPGIFPYFIRRIRMASNIPLVDVCKKHGYPTEYQINFDGSFDTNTTIVSFPCKYPEHTVFAKDMSAIDQLEVIKELQTKWSDNAVSVTIYYRLNELDEIKEWLKKNYKDNVKTCSFLLHNDHGFTQAPFEEISKEEYEDMITKVTPITNMSIHGLEMDEESCPGGMCPIR